MKRTMKAASGTPSSSFKWALLSVLSAGLIAACSAPDGKGSDGTDDDGGTGGTGDDSGGDGDIMIDDVDRSETCAESKDAFAGLRRLTAVEFEASVQGIFPEIAEKWAGVSMGDDRVGYSGFKNDSRSLLMGPQSAEEVYRTALDVASLITSADFVNQILPCSADAADAACVGTFVDTYGSRLFRRGLDETERAEFVAYYESVAGRSDFSMGLKWTIVTMLQSPFFVYRSELGDDAGKLTPGEIATQLSYVFTGQPPSAELIARAEGGEFADANARVSEAKKMLATPEGKEILEEFFRQWSGYLAVRTASKEGVEDFNDIRESMAIETRMFFSDVVFEAGGGVGDLLTSPKTFIDPLLAGHYGYGASADGFEPYDKQPTQGVGVLGQGSILSAMSHPDLTSPVFRGLFVFEKLLCGIKPPVPKNVPGISEAMETNTTREKFELAHGTEPCKACHAVFEPFGFGMEDFDAVGRYRSEENTFPINAAATGPLPGSGEIAFNGLEDLAQKLAGEERVTNCVSGQLASYAYSGGGGEACLAEVERASLLRGEIGILDYFAQLAAAPSMVQRRR